MAPANHPRSGSGRWGMSDLVERLRFGEQTLLQAIHLMIEAADRIAALEERNHYLEAELMASGDVVHDARQRRVEQLEAVLRDIEFFGQNNVINGYVRQVVRRALDDKHE